MLPLPSPPFPCAQPLLLLRKGSLLTVVFNLTPRALLDELIMLDRKSLADKLSELNGWGHFSLSRHQLETGLRFRQPAVVEEVLRNLDNVRRGLAGMGGKGGGSFHWLRLCLY